MKDTEEVKLKRKLHAREAIIKKYGGYGVWSRGKSTTEKQKQAAREGIKRTRRIVALSGRLTDIERIIDEYLHKNSIEHIHEFSIGRKIVDFYLSSSNEVLEADSDYWHQNKEVDLKRDEYIKKRNPFVRVYHFVEKDIKSGDWVKYMNEEKRCLNEKVENRDS